MRLDVTTHLLSVVTFDRHPNNAAVYMTQLARQTAVGSSLSEHERRARTIHNALFDCPDYAGPLFGPDICAELPYTAEFRIRSYFAPFGFLKRIVAPNVPVRFVASVDDRVIPCAVSAPAALHELLSGPGTQLWYAVRVPILPERIAPSAQQHDAQGPIWSKKAGLFREF